MAVRAPTVRRADAAGRHALLLRAALHRPCAAVQLLPVYLGLLGEYGNVFPSRSEVRLDDGIPSGGLFLGVDTLLGPLCIAYARAEGGRANYHLTLGQPLGGRRPGFRPR